jgi:hypothetical protein
MSTAAKERPERAAQSNRRFRCPGCAKSVQRTDREPAEPGTISERRAPGLPLPVCGTRLSGRDEAPIGLFRLFKPSAFPCPTGPLALNRSTQSRNVVLAPMRWGRLLPVEPSMHHETLRSHTLNAGERLLKGAIEAGSPNDPEAITASLDSTFVRSSDVNERHFEVRGAMSRLPSEPGRFLPRLPRTADHPDGSRAHEATDRRLVPRCDAVAARHVNSEWAVN